MNVPVLTAVTGAAWEADFVAALEGGGGVEVVRRCVDVADLLAAATTGTARAALVWSDLRRLDREVVARLRSCGLGVVGLVDSGDVASERRLRQLGLADVVAADTAPGVLAAIVLTASTRPRPADDSSGVGISSASADGPWVVEDVEDLGTEVGRMIAVWGPTGAPGRTTTAVEMASELARGGSSVVLADADVYGGAVAQRLGLLDEAPGLAAAARLANNGELDLAALAQVAGVLRPGLRVLTGLSRPSRWPELRPAALAAVWSTCRRLATWTVADCGFCLEEDEDLSYDTAAPRRNGATVETLRAADVVVAVASADPVGIARLVRSLPDLHEVAPEARVTVLINQVRRGAVGPDPQGQLTAALHQHAGVTQPLFVPYDRATLDTAVLHGRVLADVAPGSAVRQAFAALAAEVADSTNPTGPGLRRRRRRQR